MYRSISIIIHWLSPSSETWMASSRDTVAQHECILQDTAWLLLLFHSYCCRVLEMWHTATHHRPPAGERSDGRQRIYHARNRQCLMPLRSTLPSVKCEPLLIHVLWVITHTTLSQQVMTRAKHRYSIYGLSHRFSKKPSRSVLLTLQVPLCWLSRKYTPTMVRSNSFLYSIELPLSSAIFSDRLMRV